jgi:phosphate transport system substrate-binding protein
MFVHSSFTVAGSRRHLRFVLCAHVSIRTYRHSALAAVAVGTLVLAACGDDDDSTANTTAAVATAAAAPTTTSAGGATTTESGATTTSGGSEATQAMKPVSGTLNGSGATSQAAAIQAWTAGFQEKNPDATVNYDPVGSGGGREAFLSGAADFAGSDAALSDDEYTKSKSQCGDEGAIDLPHYISPIAIAFNLPDVKDLNLSPETAAGLFHGEITKWNDAKIAADNPDAKLPDTAVNPVHRSDKSGTTQNFTDYLHAAASSVWTAEAAQDWPDGLPGEAAQGTSGVVAAIQAGEGSVGYADASQVGELGVAKIKVGSDFVAPSADGAAKAVELSDKATGRSEYDLSFTLNRTPTDSSAYPLTLVSYHIVCLTYKDAAKADLVKAFMSYVGSSDGQQAAAKAAGSAPMSDALIKQVAASVAEIKAG